MPNTEHLSLCYANRSAALLHLGQYETCLEDIIRAQRHGYPERLQPKMMLRKAECLVALRRPREASQTLRDLESNFTAQATLTASQSLQRNLSHLKMKVQEQESLMETFPRALTKACEDLDLGEENEQISSASSAVSLCTDPVKGRYLVATKDILPGQILVKEEAFVSVLNPGETPLLQHDQEGKFSTRVTNGDLYCHRCLKRTLATVPCSGCSYAKYCSQKCLQQAWDRYHSVECSLGHLLLTLGVFCHVALRSTLLARFEDFGKATGRLGSEVRHKDSCLPESKSLARMLSYHLGKERERTEEGVTSPVPGCKGHGKYENDYNAVFNLLPHTENHSPEHKFLCALSVSALCRQLEASSVGALPTAQEPPALEAAETAVLCPELTLWGVAMLRHTLQLQCNAQAISSIRHTGPHESRMGMTERQQKLRSQYFFDCSCSACQKEKLSLAAGPRWEAFCCHRCRALLQGGDVLSCGNSSCTESVRRDHLIARLRDLRQQIGTARKLLRNSKLVKRAVGVLLGCQRDAESFLSLEHTAVGEIADALAQAYAALGDWQKSAAHLRKSLHVVEVRHGPSSIEMGHELFKLAQILFNGCAVAEALSTIHRAEKVLLVHCDPGDSEIQELQQMKFCLLDLPPPTPAEPLV